MLLDQSTIERIANWQAIHQLPVEDMKALLKELPAALGSAVTPHQLEHSKSGLSNYDAFFVSAGEHRYGSLTGFGVFVSSLVPVVAVGPMSIYVSPKALSWSSIEPATLLEPESCFEPLPSALFALLSKTEYRVIGRSEALVKLPDGVRPYEYCLSNEPWDKVFHLLFANTD